MAWDGTPADISHYIILVIHTEPGALYISLATPVPLSPNGAFGTREKERSVRTAATAGHHRHYQQSTLRSALKSIPLHSPSLEPIDISLVYGVGGFFLLVPFTAWAALSSFLLIPRTL